MHHGAMSMHFDLMPSGRMVRWSHANAKLIIFVAGLNYVITPMLYAVVYVTHAKV